MFEEILFITSALLTIVSSILVAMTRDILHACIFLLFALIGVAGLYVVLGADFIAATQLMVYVGGVVILMLFAVMLTGGKNLAREMRLKIENNSLMGGNKSYIWALIVGAVVASSISSLLSRVVLNHGLSDISPYTSTLEGIGRLLVGKHVLAFEISSVLLLGALVGAASIARPSKEAEVGND